MGKEVLEECGGQIGLGLTQEVAEGSVGDGYTAGGIENGEADRTCLEYLPESAFAELKGLLGLPSRFAERFLLQGSQDSRA